MVSDHSSFTWQVSLYWFILMQVTDCGLYIGSIIQSKVVKIKKCRQQRKPCGSQIVKMKWTWYHLEQCRWLPSSSQLSFCSKIYLHNLWGILHTITLSMSAIVCNLCAMQRTVASLNSVLMAVWIKSSVLKHKHILFLNIIVVICVLQISSYFLSICTCNII